MNSGNLQKTFERLVIERDRLGLTQDQMAAACAVAKRTYCDYESGKSEPRSSFFEAFAKAGGDVVFVITGQRTVTELAPDEAALLDNYRNTPPARRSTLQEVSAAFAEQDGLTTKTSGG